MLISVGDQTVCAVSGLSDIKCWGNGSSGQIGDGDADDELSATPPLGLAGTIDFVSEGGDHSCALTQTGGAKCWGQGTSGQIGDGLGLDQFTPQDVSGLTSGVRGVASGKNHSCAVLTTGAAKCWGEGDYGQVGDGNLGNELTPVDVITLSSGVASVSCGGNHSCALLNDGTVRCWGRGSSGQIGNGQFDTELTPVAVVGLSRAAIALTTGDKHTCALLDNNTVQCWGEGIDGQLGNGGNTIQPNPVAVSGIANAIAIAAGGAHTCALLDTGDVQCWGDGADGRLGDGDTGTHLSPVSVSSLSGVVVAIGVGAATSCALLATGAAQCWGDAGAGIVGDGHADGSHSHGAGDAEYTPANVAGFP